MSTWILAAVRTRNIARRLAHEALRLAVRRFRPPRARARWLRLDSKDFARSSSFLRDGLNPCPPRFMKYVSIRMPD
jgi:hypothetical protein